MSPCWMRPRQHSGSVGHSASPQVTKPAGTGLPDAVGGPPGWLAGEASGGEAPAAVGTAGTVVGSVGLVRGSAGPPRQMIKLVVMPPSRTSTAARTAMVALRFGR